MHRLGAAALLATTALVMAACSSPSSSSTPTTAVPNASGVGQPSPFLGGNLAAVGCGAPSLCVAAGASFDPNPAGAVLTASTDVGGTWSVVRSSAPASTAFTSVGCAGASCIAAGQANGAPWAIGATLGHHLAWVPTSPLPGGSGIGAVACSDSRLCLVTGGQSPVSAFATSDAGASWQTLGTLPTSTQAISHLDCSSRTHCVGVGVTSSGAPVIDRTVDGGATWQSATLPTATSIVLGAACSSAGRCVAAARTGAAGSPELLLSTDDGATFTASTSVGAVVTPTAASCRGTTCVLVGADRAGAAAASAYRGASPASSFTLHYLPTPLVAVSCASSTWCEAVSASSLVSLTP